MSLLRKYFTYVNVQNAVYAGLVLCPYAFKPLLNMG
jgi:hypothetical protein